MRALTVLQPWAWFLAQGKKQFETRPWFTSYRGPIAIHAGKGRQGDFFTGAEQLAGRCPARLTYGAIVAVADLVEVVRVEHVRGRLTTEELRLGDYTSGRFAWHFPRVVPLETPIQISGAQGLWNLPDEIAGLLADHIKRECSKGAS